MASALPRASRIGPCRSMKQRIDSARPAGQSRGVKSERLALIVGLGGVLLAQVSMATEARVFRDGGGAELRYRWHAPADAGAGGRLPLVLFLHGAGERGDDNHAQLKHGVEDILAWSRDNGEPCLLVAPQCPAESSWAAFDRGTRDLQGDAEPTPAMRLVIGLLDELLRDQPVDPRRVYVTGLSMGGFGTWFLLARIPERIAAAVPICGGGDPSTAGRFKQVPVWAFHGARDPVVPPETTRRMIEALRREGALPGSTEYPDAGHDSWTATYRDGQVLRWIFSQRRPGE